MEPICNKNPEVQSKATVPPCYYYLCVPGQRKTYKNTCLLVKLVWGQGTRATPPPRILPFPESKAKCLKRPAQVVGLQQQAHQAGCSPGSGVWQTRGYCRQRSPKEGNSLSHTPPLSTPSRAQPGNRRCQRIKGH